MSIMVNPFLYHSMQKFVFDNKLDKRRILNVDNHVGMPSAPIEIPITASRAFVCSNGVGYTVGGVVGGGPRVNGNVQLHTAQLGSEPVRFGGESKGSVCFIYWKDKNSIHGAAWVMPLVYLGRSGQETHGSVHKIIVAPADVYDLVLSSNRYSVMVVTKYRLHVYIGHGRWSIWDVRCDTAASTDTNVAIRQSNTIKLINDPPINGIDATFNGDVGTLGALVYVNKQLIVADTTSFWVSDSLQGVSHPTFSTNINIGYTILDIKQAGSHIVVVTADGLFLFRQSGTEWVFVWSVSTTTGFVSIMDLGQDGYDNGCLAVGNFVNNTLSIWESGYSYPYSNVAFTGTNVVLINDGISKITAVDGTTVSITLPQHGTWLYIEITGDPARLDFKEYQVDGGSAVLTDIFSYNPDPDARFTFIRKTITAKSTWFLAGSVGAGTFL